MSHDPAALSVAVGADVSRETTERLHAYADLLRHWNERVNLVAMSTIPQLWQRHIVDSAQLLAHSPARAASWVDLGSGAGLPGIVIACLTRQFRPELCLTMIESDRRKCAFLTTAARKLDLNVAVISQRIEIADQQMSNVVSARALAPLTKLLPLVARHLAPGGVAILPKGRAFREEIAAALVSWSFSYEIHPSRTSQDSVILKLEAPIRV